MEGLEVVPANEIWELKGNTTATVSYYTDIEITGSYKLATIHGNLVSLYKIQQGPNKGNYYGIEHKNGTDADFFRSNSFLFGVSGEPNKGYSYEYKYVVGKERVLNKWHSGNLGPIAKGGMIEAIGDKYEFSSTMSVVNASNAWLYGDFDSNGKWQADLYEGLQQTALNSAKDWVNPFSYGPAHLSVNFKMKSSVSFKTYNSFQQQTKGIYNMKNYGSDWQSAKKLGLSEWQKTSLEIDATPDASPASTSEIQKAGQ